MSVLYAGAVGAAIYNSWPAHPASFTGHRTLPRQLVIEIKQTWPHKLSGNWHAKMINFADAYLKWSWRLRPDFAQNKQTVSLNCNWARLQSKKKKEAPHLQPAQKDNKSMRGKSSLISCCRFPLFRVQPAAALGKLFATFYFYFAFWPKSKLFANIFCCSLFAAVVHTIETKITLKQL